ncbi:hypothetical protein PINS_up020671 [Pythium insidiosum]|nr:hypothetical protein PINS_up020671 [Pythium insidiosum]
MRTLIGARDTAVSGALKTFLFTGDGVGTGDFAKFVPSTAADCSVPGVSVQNLQKEFDDLLENALYLYENVPGVTVGSFNFASDTVTAGLQRVLCYRFGGEQYFFYRNFRVDIKTIWRLKSADPTRSGRDQVAVVNELKLMSIDGVGVSTKDKVKWVNESAQTDQACEDLPPQGLISQTISVFANLSMWYPFEYGSGGSRWRLCYKFDSEPYRLFPTIFVSVMEIVDLLDTSYKTFRAWAKSRWSGSEKRGSPLDRVFRKVMSQNLCR